MGFPSKSHQRLWIALFYYLFLNHFDLLTVLLNNTQKYLVTGALNPYMQAKTLHILIVGII